MLMLERQFCFLPLYFPGRTLSKEKLRISLLPDRATVHLSPCRLTGCSRTERSSQEAVGQPEEKRSAHQTVGTDNHRTVDFCEVVSLTEGCQSIHMNCYDWFKMRCTFDLFSMFVKDIFKKNLNSYKRGQNIGIRTIS